MMRLAYVCADPGVPVFGSKGCSIHVQEFLRELLNQEIVTTMIAARIENPRPIHFSGINVFHSPVTVSKDSAKREKEAFSGNLDHLALLRKHAPFDVIYERYSLWSHAGMTFARERGVPGILEVNAPLIEEQELHRTLVDRETALSVARRAFGNATSIVAVSEAVARYVECYPEAAGKVSVHPNGVDEARFNPSCKPVFEQFSEFTIGFVGSLKPWHGLETLADAFALVRESMPGARLLIVGSGPERDPLVDRLRRAGSLPYCTFTGKVGPDKIPGLLAGMDVGVAPALPQSPSGDYFSPLKLFEYMAMGLPVVCSRSGQMKEIVSNGENGLLFEPGRAEDLAEKLIGIGRDRALRKRLGAAAHKTVIENHTWRAVVTNILKTVDTSHVTSRAG